MNEEAAFVIVKPDAIERCLVGKIITRIEETYMSISGLQERHKTLEWAKEHYGHLKGEPFFGELCRFMTMSPILALNVIGSDAVYRMRKLAGATDSRIAAPGTIRGDWGHYPIMYNLIHVSDSPGTAHRERELFYDITTTEGA